MVTREMVHAVVDSVDEERLEELYRIANEIVADRKPEERRDLITMLREIRIDAPEDFSENLDLYASGEKTIGDVH
jgi:aromatic ring-opening dioxygenase LigB subunit